MGHTRPSKAGAAKSLSVLTQPRLRLFLMNSSIVRGRLCFLFFQNLQSFTLKLLLCVLIKVFEKLRGNFFYTGWFYFYCAIFQKNTKQCECYCLNNGKQSLRYYLKIYNMYKQWYIYCRVASASQIAFLSRRACWHQIEMKRSEGIRDADEQRLILTGG